MQVISRCLEDKARLADLSELGSRIRYELLQLETAATVVKEVSENRGSPQEWRLGSWIPFVP
jgi:hypothetical protein